MKFIQEPLVGKNETKAQNKDEAAHTNKRVLSYIIEYTAISSTQLSV